MTTEIHQRYAWRWIQEAVGVGVILGIVAYALVEIGGFGAVLVIIGVQLLGAALLVFSLFQKVEAMIHDLTEVEVDTNTYELVQDPEWEEWSHRRKGNEDGKGLFKVSGKTRTATFVVDSDGVRVKSRLNRWLLNDDWVQEATEYLETVVYADKG